MLQVRLYFNTGFDGVNIPAEPEMLDSGNFAFKDVPGVDLLQRKGLGKITVKCKYGFEYDLVPPPGQPSWSQHTRTLESVDYIKVTGQPEGNDNYTLGSVYYSVLGVEMLSTDTAALTIVEDFITTAGGFKQLKFNAGIITRRSGKKESFAHKRKIPDEYLVCAYPMHLAGELVGDDARPDRTYTLVESTIDLTKGMEVKKISDPDDPEVSVTVPTMSPISGTTQYEIGRNVNNASLADPVPNPTGARIYTVTSGGTIQLGIQNARALGLEKCILNQYVVPQDMLLYSYNASGNTLRGRKKSFESLSIIPPTLDQDKYNVAMFQIARIGMVGASGEQVEFDASEVYTEDNSTGIENPVKVVRVVDPRPDGRPYYRFASVNSLGSETLNTPFVKYAVAGAKWVKLPLMYTEVSGIDILEQKYKNTRTVEARQFAGQSKVLEQAAALARLSEAGNYVGGGASLVGSGISSIAKTWITPALNVAGWLGGKYARPFINELADDINLGGAGGNVGGLAGQAIGFMGSHASHMAATNIAEMLQTNAADIYNAQHNKELYDYGVQIANVVPEVVGTGDVNFIRDITQNKCYVYTLTPGSSDMRRLNRILKMFGEKDFTCIDGSDHDDPDFTNGDVWRMIGGRYFKYVKIQGAEVRTNYEIQEGGQIPNYPIMSIAEREGVKAQLGAGVRIWMIAPEAYKDIDDPTNYAVPT